MTTDDTPTLNETSKRLTEVILKGDDQDAARIAGEIASGRAETNDVVDTISETMTQTHAIPTPRRSPVKMPGSAEGSTTL